MPHFHFVGRNLAEAWSDIDSLDESSIDTQAERFRGGVNNWIIQTYLRLKSPLVHAGMQVSIGEVPVAGAINLTHRDTLRRFSGKCHHYYTVGIRADRPPIEVCDWEILQNDLHAMHGQQRYLPFWPQPGMIARKLDRGSNIERIAYFGRTGTISSWLTSPVLQAALQQLGVAFEIREDRWFDYSDVDLVLAHRHEAPTMLEQKPPSKLINAWHAGVPAMLGNEPAFEHLRQGPLDYLSTDSATDVIAAVLKVKNEPQLYQAMIENGWRRSEAFSVAAIRQRWLDFLLNEVLPDAQQTFAQGCLVRHGMFKPVLRSAVHNLQSRWFKTRCAWERYRIQDGDQQWIS